MGQGRGEFPHDERYPKVVEWAAQRSVGFSPRGAFQAEVRGPFFRDVVKRMPIQTEIGLDDPLRSFPTLRR